MSNVEIKHSKYDLLLAELEKEREQKEAYRLKYETEKLRAVLLQEDLDNIDDFNAFVETEITRSLSRKPS